MPTRKAVLILGLTLILLLAGVAVAAAQGPDASEPASTQAALGTGFTYQGRLTNSGSPVNATCNFRFSLWDAGGTSGSQIGNDHTVSNVQVSDGRFTAQVNTGDEFGVDAFAAAARWLEVKVNCPNDSTFQRIGRQKLQPAPFAHFANNGPFWKLTGNAGTNSSTDFLGTTDEMTLTVAVSDTTALRIAPASHSPNIIGGFSGNSVGSFAEGATIGGGGDSVLPNQVTQSYGTIGGGHGNTASGYNSTVGGGQGNTASDGEATVAGGIANNASGNESTIAGGFQNTASGRNTTVGGGGYNDATAEYATVGGGRDNTASARFATIAGGGPADPLNPVGSNNRVFDEYGTVGGGGQNRAGSNDADTTNASFATVGGGRANTASGLRATVAGGFSNAARVLGATVAGGQGNVADGGSAFVGGGDGHDALAKNSVIGGGFVNTISDTASYATIGGGNNNLIGDGAEYATISGGGPFGGSTRNNRVFDEYGTIGGGGDNQAGSDDANTSNSRFATVAGGSRNRATGSGAVVGGGDVNLSSGTYSTVAGGHANTASGQDATVPGGASNRATRLRSFAAGYQANAVHKGSFVWGDNTSAPIYSGDDDQFVARATGGFWFGTASSEVTATIGAGVFITTSTGAHLTDGGTWTNASDRSSKEQFRPVDAQSVLDQLADLPIQTWSYRAEDDGVRHMGPAAQDFQAAFGLGHDDVSISTVDADGVSLVAIQGLHQIVQEQQATIQAQYDQIATLQQKMTTLQRLVEKDVTQQRAAHSGLPVGNVGWLVAGLLLGYVLWRRE